MKFTKGLILGGLVTAGILMMYSESDMMTKNKKKMIKKENNLLKKWELCNLKF